ncbi:5-hydroxyisourate hydrolase [Tribonema minus]|uniref:5-hydroxyisourate hydrolase n=1 Tax=Tribonema minus TaxID=303371 RepID=A0A836CBZ0_9STRA|nr:5-hydroxyisourate hydrolase [Tribonema minus]
MDGHQQRLHLLARSQSQSCSRAATRPTMSRSPITSHVLDTARGRPAEGVPMVLHALNGASWTVLGSTLTDSDGRAPGLLPANAVIRPGVYKITFDTAAYFGAIGVQAFYPEVTIVFEIDDASQHYHVPLLLNPYGYSTYRGS